MLNEEAEDLAARCPMGVFDIEDLGGGGSGKKGKAGAGGGKQAVVARPRDCTMCRECVREGPAKEKVKLRRVADHFIFSIESVGSLAPERILKDVRALVLLFGLFLGGEGCVAAVYRSPGASSADLQNAYAIAAHARVKSSRQSASSAPSATRCCRPSTRRGRGEGQGQEQRRRRGRPGPVGARAGRRPRGRAARAGAAVGRSDP